MQQIKIGIIMGSQSDWPTMQEAANILDDLGINFEKKLSLLIGHQIDYGIMGSQQLNEDCKSSLLELVEQHICLG